MTGIISAREAIDELGGAAIVARRLKLSASAVRNWSSRSAIPPAWEAAFLQLCEQHQVWWRPPGWDLRVQLRFVRDAPVGVAPAEAERSRAA